MDKPRLLARRSEVGYTDRTRTALAGEPEAVSETEQRELTARVHRDEQRRRADAWKTANTQIDGALERFEPEGHPDKRTTSDTRAIRRTAARITERLDSP